jgi:glyoxylase-like metal-dependent hydrolase (beta-lactamase superfamily II)
MLVNEQLSIYRVRLPLPFRLKNIYAYAIQGSKGWNLIDTGLNTEATRMVWQKFMADHQITGLDIKRIYITHAHPDHFGAAGWLQQLSGAPVYLSAADAKNMQRIWQGDFREVEESVSKFLIQNGMPLALTQNAVKRMEQMVSMLVPFSVLKILDAEKAVKLGDFQYLPMVTPGHSQGHICFYNSESGVLLSGDHLLAKITSNISLFPNNEPDPLKYYLQSFQSLRSLQCKTVLPAHGPVFTNLEQRISELEAHHEERLQLMIDFAKRGATGYEICLHVFNQEIENRELRLAMTETMAHLMHLVYRGKLTMFNRDGINVFKQS